MVISVALCTYNGEKYIRQQLDSILSQTMPVDEIVIHDDRSTDSTYEILSWYASQYSQIKLIRNIQNVGYKKNFEEALRDCNGDYIFFSDQDDVWAMDKVAESVEYLRTTGMYGAFTDAHLIDQNGENMGITLFSHQQLWPYIENDLLQKFLFEVLCLKGNFVTGATLVITKAAKELVLPYRTALIMAHDGWIALKLSSMGKLGYINKTLMSYRIHPKQQAGLDLSDRKGRDQLIDCFLDNGNIKNLLQMRRSTAGIIYVCGFGKREKEKLFLTYRRLYDKCQDRRFGSTQIEYKLRFLFMEFFVFIRSKIGYRL